MQLLIGDSNCNIPFSLDPKYSESASQNYARTQSAVHFHSSVFKVDGLQAQYHHVMEEIRALNATVTALIQRIDRREPAPVAAAAVAAADIGRNVIGLQVAALDQEFPAPAELHAVNANLIVHDWFAGRGEARWTWPDARSRRSLVRGSVFEATSAWCRERSLGREILHKW